LCRRRRRLRAGAMKTQQEKEQAEATVEESFPVREAAPLGGADDQAVPTDDSSWVVNLEQSVNIFLVVITTRSA
jgi:ubiquinol oxidase